MINALLIAGCVFLVASQVAVADQRSLSIRDEVCSISDPALIHAQDIPLEPEYFFRPFPLSNAVAMAAGGENYFLDIDTGKATKVPGKYDALPLPDEKFWVYPTGEALHFRKLNGGKDDGPAYVDLQMVGEYQSAGMLKDSQSGAKYRVILDRSKGSTLDFIFQDYSEDLESGVRPVYPQPKLLCSNLEGPHSLPMLSKDGERISLLDVKAGRTKIYHIDSATGSCALELELFQFTGKVDFSFDGKTIAYHTIERLEAKSIQHNGLWFKTPQERMVANVWTMNLETREAKQITHFTESSALYPAFNLKGQILVRKFKKDGKATILTYDPAKEPRSINSSLFEDCVNCIGERKLEFSLLATLGQLFSNLCIGPDTQFTPQSKALFVMNLDKVSCHRLAQNWAGNKEAVLEELKALNVKNQVDLYAVSSFGVTDLLSVCPKEQVSGDRNIIPVRTISLNAPDLSKIPTPLARCLSCHGPNSALPMPFDQAEEFKAQLLRPSIVHPGIRLVDEMKARVETRAVPPANNLGAKSLKDAEANEILDWLEAVAK